jgi:phosphoglycerol transferase MdoB-like AlkP superfamily enzyme
MKGAHAQYTMSEDFQHIEYDPRRDIDNGTELSQATGSVKIVFEYIKQLKELGKYDDATIIITADHGSRITSNLSYPILFVKESGENSNQIKESVAPVCQADLIPTIEKAAGVEYSEPTIEEYAENDTRTRTFRIKDGNTYIKYEIDGDVKNEGNWKMIYSNE